MKKKKHSSKLLRPALFLIVIFICFLKASAQLAPGIRANGIIRNTGDTVTVCKGSGILYQSAATGATQINWRFNLGSPLSSSANAVTVTYNTAGIDSTIQVVSGSGQSDSMYIIVRVSDERPTAAFSFAPDNVCGNIPVAFTSTSTGNGLSYLWQFGDGNTSTAVNPVHQFLNATGPVGTVSYGVKLVVTNSSGCKDSVTRSLTIRRVPDASIGNAEPSVVFGPFNGVPTFRRCSILPSALFSFINQSSTITTNQSYTIKWGDGSPDSTFTAWNTGVVISHVYPLGNKILTIEVTGPDGCIGIKKYNVFLGSNPAGGLSSLGNTDVCTADSLRFVVNGVTNNPPGTLYTFLVNDGTVPQVFAHPPPDTMRHQFITGSCSFSSSSGNDTYSNAFGAYLTISNPCGSTSPSVVPIYVSGRPAARMQILPSRTVCVNSTVTIRNVSGYGGVVTPTGGTGSTCTLTGKQVWSISPSAGYSITSGSLGSLNGNPQNSLVWTQGTQALSINFTAAGTYTVKLYVANDRCGIDSTVQTICVRNPPQASFTLSSRTACTAGTATVSNTSPAATCGGDVYSWTVTYLDPAACGPGSSFSFINGTSASSVNPQFQFNAPGQYVITLSVSAVNASAFSCPAATARDTFTVKAKPKPVIAAINAVCVGNSINPSAAVSACYSTAPLSYSWTFTGGTPSGAASPVPGPVSYAATGTYPVILEVTNECGSTSDTADAIITPPPAADAGQDKQVCSGEPVTIGAQAVTGVTYQWTPAAGLSNAGIAMPTAVLSYNGASADSVFKFIVTASAGANCSNIDSVFITVKKKPDVSVAATPPVICAGDSSVLTASGADSYSWSPAGTLSSNTGAVVTAKPPATAVYSVTGSRNGCADTVQVTVQVNSVPLVSAGPDTVICNNNTAVQLTGSPAGGSWAGNNISAAGIFNAQAAGNGTYKVYYTYGSNNCSVTDSTVITVSNPPAAFAGNDTTICQSSNPVQLTATPAGGSWSGSTQVSASGLLNTSIAGTYTLVYSVGGGSCIGRDTVVINIGAGINGNAIDAARNVCTGLPAGIINGGVPQGGGGAYTYQWEQSPDGISGWTLIGGANGQNYDPGVIAQSACFRRRVTTQTCGAGLPSISNTMCITIRPDARALFTAADTLGCAGFVLGSTITVTPFPAGNDVYTWYSNNTAIGSNTTGIFPGYTIQPACDTADLKLVVNSPYGCKSDSATRRFFTVCDVIPRFTKSTGSGCGTLDVSFVNTSSSLNPAYQYRWNFGNGIVSSLMQPGTVRFNSSLSFTDTTYYITLRVFNGCDTALFSDSVKVLPPPNARFSVDTTRGCSTFLPLVTNESLGFHFSYYWDFGNGQLDTTSTLVRPRQPVYTTGVIDTFAVQLIAQNVCGRDTAQTDIIVSPRTIQAQISVGGTSLEGCAPHLATFNNGSIGAARVIWNFGDGSLPDTTANAQAAVQHLYTSPGTYQVVIRLINDCTDTLITRQVIVYPKPAAAFTLNKYLLCLGDSIVTVNSSSGGNSYEWIWGDGTATAAFNAVHVYNTPGTYTVQLVARRISNLGVVCTDTASISVQVVARIPAVIQAAGSNVACAPYVLSVTAQGASAAARVEWTFFDNTTPPGQFTASGLSAAYQYNLPGIYSVKLVVINSAGCRDSTLRSFTVNPRPVTAVQLDTISTCSRDTVIRCTAQVQYSGTAPLNFTWYVDGVAVGTGNPYFQRFVTPAALLQPKQFNVQVQAVSAAGCGDTSAGVLFTVQPLPQVRIAVQPGQVISQPNHTFTFSDTVSFSPNKNYLWNLGDQSELRTGRSVVHTYGKHGTYLAKLLVTDFSTGCKRADSIRVTILYVKGTLYVPNAFYPNSQKQELRLFKPEGIGLERYHLQVFDGLGRLIFETKKLTADGAPAEGWDGTVNGTAMPQDAYTWRIITADFKNGTNWEGMQYNGRKPTRFGSVTLFR